MRCKIQPGALCLHTILRSQLDSPHTVCLLIAVVVSLYLLNERFYHHCSILLQMHCKKGGMYAICRFSNCAAWPPVGGAIEVKGGHRGRHEAMMTVF